MGSFLSIFGFEFVVRDARTDRNSFTNGAPRNGGKSRTSENIEACGGNGGDGGNGGSGMASNGGDSVKGGDAYARSSSADVRRCRIQTL